MQTKELRRVFRCWVASGLPAVLGGLPRFAAEAFCAGVGRAAYTMIPRDRRRAHQNLRRVHPGWSEAEIERMAKASFKALGRSICDFVRYPRLSAEERERLVHIEGLEHLEALHVRKQGAVLVTAHLGCWELIGAVVASRYPFRGLARPMREARLDRLLQRHRRAMGIQTIDTGNPRRAVQFVRDGGFLAVLIDQRVPQGLQLKFLGQPTRIAGGAARIAKAVSVPLVPVAITRQGSFHRMEISTPVPPPESRREIAGVTQALVDELGAAIGRCPEQWMWIHPRWEGVGEAHATPLLEDVA